VQHAAESCLDHMKRDCNRAIALSLAAALAWLAAPHARAEEYPSRPVKIIVPVSPGGITDIVARLAGEYITARTGQPVVVENRTGAGGNIGVEAVAKAAPDGYVLSLATTSQIAINPATSKHMPFDALNDLVPVAPIAEAPQLLIVNAKVPAKTLQEFIAYARQNPGKLNFVSLGPGSTVSLAGEQFARLARLDMVPVQYRGTAPGITDAGADCAPLQPRPVLHSSFGAGVCQICSPVASFSANRPPASFAAASTSDTGMYAACSSAADPHSMPPSAPPLPALKCQSSLPSLSGSSPHTMPDFCPMTSTRLPPGRLRSIGALPKSKSGPTSFGQFSLPGWQ